MLHHTVTTLEVHLFFSVHELETATFLFSVAFFLYLLKWCCSISLLLHHSLVLDGGRDDTNSGVNNFLVDFLSISWFSS